MSPVSGTQSTDQKKRIEKIIKIITTKEKEEEEDDEE